MKTVSRRAFTSRFYLEAFQDEQGTVTIEIIKTSNGDVIPRDEPLFLLRARDLLAVPLLMCYRALIQVAGYPDPEAKQEHLDSNTRVTESFTHFAREHSERMKLPNVTRGK